MNFFKRIILGSDDQTNTIETTHEPMSQQELINQIVSAFKETLAKETTKRTLMFHTSFTVYLNSEDFAERKPAFLITVKDCVADFEEIIDEIIRTNKNYKDFINPTDNWVIQFAELARGDMVEGSKNDGFISDIASGTTYIISEIFDRKQNNNVAFSDTEKLLVTKVNLKKSVITTMNGVNAKAFAGIKIESGNRFVLQMKSYGQADSQTNNSAGQNGRLRNTPPPPRGESKKENTDHSKERTDNGRNPRLKIDGAKFIDPTNGSEKSVAEIFNNQPFYIGRYSDNQEISSIPFIYVNNPELSERHLHFMYDGARGCYMVKCLADICINEREYTGSNPDWIPVMNNSVILFSNGVQITFEM